MACAVIIGLYARFHGLAEGPLAVDEYYFLASVESILRTGLPIPPGGGFYVRGIVLQYLTAVSVAVFDTAEFAVRFPAAVLGLLTGGVAFAYGNRAGGRRLGWTLAVVVLLSSWSVEFARFGRMYSAAQILTLLFLLSLQPVMSGAATAGRRYLPHVLLLLMVLTHQLGILFAPLLALPLVLPDRLRRLDGHREMAAYAGATALVYCAVLAMRFTPFRTLGVADPLPAGAADLARVPGLLRLSAFPFWSISQSATVNLVFVVGMMAFVAVLLYAVRLWGRRFTSEEILAAVVLVAAVLHQFVPAFVLLCLLLFRYRILHDPARHKRALRLSGLAGVIAIGWVAYATWLSYGLGSSAWITRAGAGSTAGALRATFFGWPDLYTPLLVPWLQEMPVLLLVVAVGVLYQVISSLRKPWEEFALNPAAVVIYIALLFGILDSLYQTTRYTFFIYPVALAALFLSVFDLVDRVSRDGSREGGWSPARMLIAPGLCLLLFGISEDFNPGHLARIDSPDVRFRTGAYENRGATWYPRFDYESPARAVNSRADPGEPVILIDVPPASYYLGRAHGIYLERDDPRFLLVSRERGSRDFWSGQRLMSTPAELEEYLHGSERAWVIRPVAMNGRGPQFGPGTSSRRVHLSLDQRIEVLLLDLN